MLSRLRNNPLHPFKVTYHQPEGKAPSFDIANSDYSGNAIYMERLVGTLVKIRERGRFTPYLASKWAVSEDGKKWRFKLHSELRCENGETIDAAGFVRSLHFSLIGFSKLMNGKVPVFSNLQGWSAAVPENLPGLRAEGDEVVFDFTRPVREGLLEFLAMPYYGYLCSANFSNGKWKSDREITSSNSYRVKNWADTAVTLEKRLDWSLADPKSPDEIVVNWGPSDLASATGKGEIFEYKTDVPFDETKFTLVNSLPTWAFGYVFQPNNGGPLANVRNRVAILNKIRELQPKIEFESKRHRKSTFFYPAQPTEVKTKHDPVVHQVKSKLQIVTYNKPIGHFGFMEKLLTQSLDELNIQYEIHRVDSSNLNFFRTVMDGPFDIRIQGVAAGGAAENWVIDMMFCSKLGAHLADPSGRICKLAKEASQSEVPYDQYLSRFNTYIYEDAGTIPIIHGSSAWLFSNDFDLSALSASFTLISFEDLKLKQP